MPHPPAALLVWAPEPVRGCGDGEMMRIADRQRGVIHREQLLLAGLTRHAIAHRLHTGWLHRLHPAVYLVGRPRTEPLAWEMAAVLHLRGCALVSHMSATAAWLATDTSRERATVTLVARSARSRPGCHVHRVVALHRDDVVLHRGLPVTSPARTLVDRAGQLSSMELENELIEMRRRTGVTNTAIAAAIARAPRRAGVGGLRQLIDGTLTPATTRSQYERKLRRLLREADLPQPIPNDPVLGYVADFHWPRQRLIVEFDGFAFHGSRRAFEHDRLRDQRLMAAGYRVLRITARQLDQTPYAVVARIAAALAISPSRAA